MWLKGQVIHSPSSYIMSPNDWDTYPSSEPMGHERIFVFMFSQSTLGKNFTCRDTRCQGSWPRSCVTVQNKTPTQRLLCLKDGLTRVLYSVGSHSTVPMKLKPNDDDDPYNPPNRKGPTSSPNTHFQTAFPGLPSSLLFKVASCLSFFVFCLKPDFPDKWGPTIEVD